MRVGKLFGGALNSCSQLLNSAPVPAGVEGSSLAGCSLPVFPIIATGLRKGLTEAKGLRRMEGQELSVWRC